METTEIIGAIIAMVSAPISGWLTVKLLRQKYNAEVEKLQAEAVSAKTNTRGDELDNVKAAMDILLDQVVEPLKREINGIRKEMARLRRAVEMANHCPYSDHCPVRDELQKSEPSESDFQARQPATHKKIRDEPRTRPHERGADENPFD